MSEQENVLQGEQADDMQTIIEDEVCVIIKKKKVVINRLKVKQLTQVLTVIMPFYEDLKSLKVNAAVKSGDVGEIKVGLLKLLITHSEEVFKLLSILTSESVEYIENLDVDDALALLLAVVEVNIDFFIQKVIPSLSLLLESLGTSQAKQVVRPAGQMPSSS